MFNPIDRRQIRSLIEYRREQVASDANRDQRTVDPRSRGERRVERVRVAIGTGLIRVGARIAGMYSHDLPHLRPGV